MRDGARRLIKNQIAQVRPLVSFFCINAFGTHFSLKQILDTYQIILIDGISPSIHYAYGFVMLHIDSPTADTLTHEI